MRFYKNNKKTYKRFFTSMMHSSKWILLCCSV